MTETWQSSRVKLSLASSSKEVHLLLAHDSQLISAHDSQLISVSTGNKNRKTLLVTMNWPSYETHSGWVMSQTSIMTLSEPSPRPELLIIITIYFFINFTTWNCRKKKNGPVGHFCCCFLNCVDDPQKEPKKKKTTTDIFLVWVLPPDWQKLKCFFFVCLFVFCFQHPVSWLLVVKPRDIALACFHSLLTTSKID